MSIFQPGILQPIPAHGRFLELSRLSDSDPSDGLRELAASVDGDRTVVGLGAGLVRLFGHSLNGLEPFPALAGPGCNIVSTQSDLWIWLRGEDRGEIARRSRLLCARLEADFCLDRTVDGFRYASGLDLSGYEDGTENPEGDAAVEAAVAGDGASGHAGGSYVAVQQWVHDLDSFEALDRSECDNIIGRRLSDNEELDDAPSSAHVKRTAQESFEPEAFLVRRSMPWSETDGEGLVFIAFGKSHAAFRAQLDRMIGVEDGVTDGLFRFSRPVTGGYYWCPPLGENGLDLTALGL